MPENLKLVASTPPRRTMILELAISPDDLRIDGGRLIKRPAHISRDRWLRLWQYLADRGFTPETLDEAARFIGVKPFSGTDLPLRRRREKQTPPKP
jgi:hypothetical protein